MNTGQKLVDERRRQRRAGDPRLSETDRAFLARLADGDLAEQFQAALDAASSNDPILGGNAGRDD